MKRISIKLQVIHKTSALWRTNFCYLQLQNIESTLQDLISKRDRPIANGLIEHRKWLRLNQLLPTPVPSIFKFEIIRSTQEPNTL